MKSGIVITTHNRWEAAQECIASVIRHVRGDRLILIYDNESTDEQTRKFPQMFPEIEYIRIDNQYENGGLTGTWNQGADRCIAEGCDVILFLNHDTVVNKTINKLINAPRILNFPAMFGPYTNNAPYNKHQVAEAATEGYHIFEKLVLINGFCFAVSKETLILNKFDQVHFFDPKRPFAENENEFFRRLYKKGGKAVLVKCAYVYHRKFGDWRSHKKEADKRLQ